VEEVLAGFNQLSVIQAGYVLLRVRKTRDLIWKRRLPRGAHVLKDLPSSASSKLAPDSPTIHKAFLELVDSILRDSTSPNGNEYLSRMARNAQPTSVRDIWYHV